MSRGQLCGAQGLCMMKYTFLLVLYDEARRCYKNIEARIYQKGYPKLPPMQTDNLKNVRDETFFKNYNYKRPFSIHFKRPRGLRSLCGNYGSLFDFFFFSSV